MKKQILAVIAGITLLTAFLIPPMSSNSFAQVTSESRVLQAILGLTEVVKGESQALVDTTENIEDDLLFKKKFWQYRPCFGQVIDQVSDASFPGCVFATSAGVVGVHVKNCNLPEETACAFNVESINLYGNGADVVAICVDSVCTDVSAKDIRPPASVLVESAIGKIGASDFVFILFDSPYTGPLEFNGEKPQGMELEPVLIGTELDKAVESFDMEEIVYNYTEHNTGTESLAAPSLIDNNCSPIVFVGGDNTNNQLDPSETWTYQCNRPFGEFDCPVIINTVISNTTSVRFPEIPVLDESVTLTVDISGLPVCENNG
jgi:hypothetical protein